LICELVVLSEKLGHTWAARVAANGSTFLPLPAFWSVNAVAL
jgi:hypothetical protein